MARLSLMVPVSKYEVGSDCETLSLSLSPVHHGITIALHVPVMSPFWGHVVLSFFQLRVRVVV